MKRSLAALGLIMLLVGILMMSYSNTIKKRLVTEEPPIAEAIPQNPPVSISGYFSEGELYNVYISPGIGWDQDLEPASDETPYNSRFVWVNITDPLGNTTIFEFAFGAIDSGVALYMISVLSSNFSRERTAPSPNTFALEAKMNGTYTAKLWAILPPSSNVGPFGAFRLNKLHIEDERSFSYLLFVGAGTSILGIAVLAVAKLDPWKKQKRKQYKKTINKSN